MHSHWSNFFLSSHHRWIKAIKMNYLEKCSCTWKSQKWTITLSFLTPLSVCIMSLQRPAQSADHTLSSLIHSSLSPEIGFLSLGIENVGQFFRLSNPTSRSLTCRCSFMKCQKWGYLLWHCHTKDWKYSSVQRDRAINEAINKGRKATSPVDPERARA